MGRLEAHFGGKIVRRLKWDKYSWKDEKLSKMKIIRVTDEDIHVVRDLSKVAVG